MIFKGTRLSELTKMSIILILGVIIIIGSSAYFFAELAEGILEEESFFIDEFAVSILNSFDQSFLASVMAAVTEAGSVTWISIGSAILAVYLLFFSGFSRWVAVFFLVNIVGIGLLTQGMKVAFARERPELLEQYDGIGFSFPSGHSTGSLAFYGFIVYVIFVSNMNAALKWVINSCLVFLIVLIGLTRVYLGVHYFSDVLAGFSFGLAWLTVCIMLLEVTLWSQRKRRVS
ncbi:phosphatase PAP2 family protein [Salipaludibacillus sp. CF4.18]|uniref:phosphatase PAP2 family protein n=1 Tax=Salipaludibacillus sp. CF4.18 TaxID=3373081 RepID=UPI003EE81C89